MIFTELEEQLESILLRQTDQSDASHGIHHARRVKMNAAEIAQREGAGDMRLLTAAAYLHDLVNVPKNSPLRASASRQSAEASAPILKELGFADDEISAITHIITAHSFSANISPETLEAKILQDADRLEALGALGIARTFYVAGQLSSELFHGDDPFAEQRPLDDARYAADHFQTKLLGLADTMQTTAGKEVAKERTQYMEGFLRQLAREISR